MRTNITSLQEASDRQGNQITELEKSAVFCSDTVVELQANVSKLAETVSNLEAKCEDLESRSRAHRTLRARPRDGEAPRPFVVRLHYFQTRENLLRIASRGGPLIYQEKRISIFPDFTAIIAKKRASFIDVKRILRTIPDVKYVLFHPAQLRITLSDGKRHSFDNPLDATAFVKRLLPQNHLAETED
ncbi:hypothetical protein SKAU_G00423230 [Synaphobranchus kaupii]|uniref:Transposase element L1Md-A101/L1Md-A102/L1Md-A2 n=1 Tax=Synaphobranchus kaupii TaxID=118154 RepID=A0A9Q1IAJ9_SYNKA|nr:hypothetical protein SKAU_G00423230 [Synaphobranchus kaupii]